MNKKFILKKSYHISQVISEKKSTANKYFVVYRKINNIDHFRIAISVGKKFGNAVKRNKIKRQIKSIIYEKIDEFEKNYDILIIVRVNANNLNYEDIKKYLINILNKSKIIKSEVY